ncbi:hypothetical protein EVAR_18206_1 [Eumeta japonica]|uniref:Uncharacterized protein n=1 Tax=Eumeta variegata TaxID=151549 RepID=A0A4C1UWL0_EUMVA|nr:hypothetical protein EVAR_18206_1 [Eumeta japonica]
MVYFYPTRQWDRRSVCVTIVPRAFLCLGSAIEGYDWSKPVIATGCRWSDDDDDDDVKGYASGVQQKITAMLTSVSHAVGVYTTSCSAQRINDSTASLAVGPNHFADLNSGRATVSIFDPGHALDTSSGPGSASRLWFPSCFRFS